MGDGSRLRIPIAASVKMRYYQIGDASGIQAAHVDVDSIRI